MNNGSVNQQVVRECSTREPGRRRLGVDQTVWNAGCGGVDMWNMGIARSDSNRRKT